MKLRKVVKLSAFFFSGLLLLISCRKSGELIPENSAADLQALKVDTTTVSSLSMYNDSLRTDETSRSVFGVFNDPVFGTTIASNYLQFNLSTTQLEFPAGTTIDSVVLIAVYENAYGNLESEVGLNVREIDEAIIEDNSYFSNSRVALKPNSIGSITFLPNFTDSTFEDTTISFPHARITLDKEIGERILSHGLFEGNDDFVDFFKGICLEPDTTNLPPPGDGLLTIFNYLSDDTRIRIYYNYPDNGSGAQFATYELNVSSGSPRFSNYRHKFTGAPIVDELYNPKKEVNYVQPLGGIKTKITFPNLKNFLKPGSVVINKAELEIHVKEGTYDEYPVPTRLVVITEDDNGTDLFVPDYFEGSSYFGGSYDVNSDTYKFNIARYLNQLVNEETNDNGLFLIVSGSAILANRLILNSGNAPENRMRLKITYTQL